MRDGSVVFIFLWILLTAAGCTLTFSEKDKSLRDLLSRLRSVQGEYERSSNRGVWEFKGNRDLFVAIAAYEDFAMPRLVECLGRTEASAVTVNGRPVPLGVVCYQALMTTAYYEHGDANGDITFDWPGYIGPEASPEQLKAAQAAWHDVVKKKLYVIP